MDPAELREFFELVGALHSCQKKGTDPLRWMKASGELLDFIEEAERVNQAAVEEVFGRRPARATTAVLQPVAAAMPQPAPARPQPAAAVMPQPAAAVMPQPAAPPV